MKHFRSADEYDVEAVVERWRMANNVLAELENDYGVRYLSENTLEVENWVYKLFFPGPHLPTQHLVDHKQRFVRIYRQDYYGILIETRTDNEPLYSLAYIDHWNKKQQEEEVLTYQMNDWRR